MRSLGSIIAVGRQREEESSLDKTQEIESLLLTKKDMINKQLGIWTCNGISAPVTCPSKWYRSFPVSWFGWSLGQAMVARKKALKENPFVGQWCQETVDYRFLPIAMGIVLGVLFGKLISFSDSLLFPGLTGGVLMVALMLSAVGKTGPYPLVYVRPSSQPAIATVVAVVSCRSGYFRRKELVATFQSGFVIRCWAAITIVPCLSPCLWDVWHLKINVLDLLGTITGEWPVRRDLLLPIRWSIIFRCSLCDSLSHCYGFPYSFIQIIATVVY